MANFMKKVKKSSFGDFGDFGFFPTSYLGPTVFPQKQDFWDFGAF